MIRKNVPNAEIIWTLNNILPNVLLKPCESLPKLLVYIVDSAIAKYFTFQKDNSSYYIIYGIGPYYKSLRIDPIKTSVFFHFFG